MVVVEVVVDEAVVGAAIVVADRVAAMVVGSAVLPLSLPEHAEAAISSEAATTEAKTMVRRGD